MKCSKVIRLIVITGNPLSDDDSESVSREASPCSESPRPVSVGSESPNENICTMPNQINNINNTKSSGTNTNMSVVSKMGSHVMLGGSGRNLLLQKAVSMKFSYFWCRSFFVNIRAMTCRKFNKWQFSTGHKQQRCECNKVDIAFHARTCQTKDQCWASLAVECDGMGRCNDFEKKYISHYSAKTR